MKLSLAALALSASVASAYNVGGFDTFGRPYFVSPRGRFRRGPGRRAFRSPRNGCAPGGRDCVDRVFEDLQKELKNDRFRSPNSGMPTGFEMDEDTLRKQQEFISRAFGLASDVAKEMASSPEEIKEADEALRQKKEWADRMFDFARDVSSGGTYSSVQAEVLQDDDEIFQVALDVPGVKADDINVTVEGTKEKILVINGDRHVGGEEARKFSKIISLDSRSDTEQMSAGLENGVLVVSIPRMAIENTDNIQKVTVNKVSDESAPSSEETATFPFELELDVPGVSASNIDITVEGDTDKTLTITAVRELGKDSEGKPRMKETAKSFKVDELVDTSQIVANLSNGVLKVSAPADKKKAEETVRKITVKQSSDSPTPVGASNVEVVEEQKDGPSLGEEEEEQEEEDES